MPPIERFLAQKKVIQNSGIIEEIRSSVFAKDADRLIDKLGYDKVSIFSGSYGTRVALTMMRDKPEHISHVILDGVFSPEVNGFSQGTSAFLAGFNHIAEMCESNAECTSKLGNTRGQIEQIITGGADHKRVINLLRCLASLSHHQPAPLLVSKLSKITPTKSATLLGDIFGDNHSPKE